MPIEVKRFLSRTEISPRAGVTLGFLLLLALIVISTSGFWLIEGWALTEALFMTIITVSTVGYGEVHPLSKGGQLFATFVIVSGLAIVTYTSAKLGQLILEGELFGVLGRRRMLREIEKLDQHYIVCGYGRIGRPVADGLISNGQGVCVIDANPENEEEMAARDYLYLIGDATEEEVLTLAGVERAKCLLALLPSDADNLYLTITAKDINRQVTIIARANDQKAVNKLSRGGADKVISPYEIAGSRVLQAALTPTAVEVMEHAAHHESLELKWSEVRISERSQLHGQSISESGIRNNYGVIIVAIKPADGDMIFNPEASQEINAHDTLVTIGPPESLSKLQEAALG